MIGWQSKDINTNLKNVSIPVHFEFNAPGCSLGHWDTLPGWLDVIHVDRIGKLYKKSNNQVVGYLRAIWLSKKSHFAGKKSIYVADNKTCSTCYPNDKKNNLNAYGGLHVSQTSSETQIFTSHLSALGQWYHLAAVDTWPDR
jgi:hypothetical protein